MNHLFDLTDDLVLQTDTRVWKYFKLHLSPPPHSNNRTYHYINIRYVKVLQLKLLLLYGLIKDQTAHTSLHTVKLKHAAEEGNFE